MAKAFSLRHKNVKSGVELRGSNDAFNCQNKGNVNSTFGNDFQYRCLI